jgi:hypothetical protein
MALAPPFSTGGGGETFEKLAGACALAALLAREELPGLDLPVTKVRFQQRYAGHLLDDIVIDGASRGVRRTLEIQARHRPRLTASDPKFVELVAVLLRAMRDNRAAMLNDTRRLGLLLELGTPGSKSLHQLTRLAWANSDPAAFYQAIAAQGHTGKPVQERLGQLVKAKAAADHASEIAEDPELWMLLRGLRVLAWSLEESTGPHRTHAINQLRGVLADDDPARAPDLFADLFKLVADLVPLAGGVTRMDLVDKLRSHGQWQLGAGPRTGGAGQAAGLTGDDLVRGPLRNLGLDGEVQRAERLRASDPAQAAAVFAAVAARLRQERFDTHADLFAERQADALIAAGSLQEAAALCLQMAAREVEQGLGPSRFLALLEPVASGLSAAEQAQIQALQAVAAWHLDPPAALTALRNALDTLVRVGHAAAPRVALFLAEFAAVTENPGVILELRTTLLTMAEQAEATLAHPDGEAVGVRLRLCVAGADGDFAGLWRRANTGRDLEPAQAALVMARYGRWLAGKADPEPAEDAYWCAVDHATTAKLWGEAAEALRSLAMLHMRFTFQQSDFVEPLLRARTVAREGEARYLPRRYDPKAAALEAWHKSGWNKNSMRSAHQDLSRYLWEARLCGHLAAELYASELLGDLYVATATPDTFVAQIGAAVGHYINAGVAKKAKEQAAEAAELGVAFDVSEGLASPVPWERAAALAVVAAQADVVPDELLEPTLRAALAATAGMPQSRLGSQVDREALGALAALSERVPAGLVGEALTVFERLLDRPPGQANVVDDDLRRGLFGLYRAHPGRRERTGRMLLRCIELGGPLGYKTALMPFENDLLEPLLPGLREQADRSVPNAILALAMAEDRHPAVLAEAEQRVDRLLAEEPRSWSGGDFQAPLFGRPRTDTACFGLLLPTPSVERLARHLLRLATEGTGDFDSTRADALNGIVLLASRLPDSVRDELVQPVLALAQASADSSFDKLWQGTLHPLSPGKVDVGRGRAPAAVLAAASLARRPEHGHAVLAAASELARQNDGPAVQGAARAIATLLDQGVLQLDPAQVLQISTDVPFRELAVIAWLHSPNPAPERGEQFVRDPARSVRLAVAAHLPRLRVIAPSLVEPLLAQLRHDPSATVRQVATEDPSKAA